MKEILLWAAPVQVLFWSTLLDFDKGTNVRKHLRRNITILPVVTTMETDPIWKSSIRGHTSPPDP